MGPLKGIRVVEMAGIGPAPFCGMLLADMGADVVRIDRPAGAADLGIDLGQDARVHITARGKRSAAIDLKRPEGQAAALALIGRADALIEGFRPGTMERLGLSPARCLGRHPRLVYGRMTGWGQTGPLAAAAGHDIDYIALTGALHAIGTPAQPLPPLNLVGDYGGGAMFLAFGVACALLECARTGQGQVVDAAIVDGATSLMAPAYAMLAAGLWRDERGANYLDGGAPWYGTYETADGGHVAVGAIEERFYAELLERLGLDPAALPPREDRARWPLLRERLAARFRSRSRDEWAALFEGTDACVAPVLGMREAHRHPHNRARDIFIDIDGVVQPAPAPRFSRTPPDTPSVGSVRGQDTLAVMRDWGVHEDTIAAGVAAGALA